jgi:hypothetical protein
VIFVSPKITGMSQFQRSHTGKLMIREMSPASIREPTIAAENTRNFSSRVGFIV